MDFTEGFHYEVPVINLEDTSYSCAKQYNEEVNVQDNDCTIIDPEISQVNQNRNGAHNKRQSDVTEKCNGESISIVIDEDSEKDNEFTIIDVDKIDENVSHTVNGHSKTVLSYDDIYKDNKQLIELIEKCLDMENTAGMLRIINRTLIPIYKDADETYKKSTEFDKILSQKIMKLDTEPERKFSHLKDLCEQLKACKTKKRASFVTLQTNLNGKSSKSTENDIPTKKKKNDIINLDDDGDDIVHIDCSSVTDIKIIDVRSQITGNVSSPEQINNDFDTHIVIDDTDQINEIDSQGQLHEKDDGKKTDSDDQTNKGNRKNEMDNDNVVVIDGDDNDKFNKEDFVLSTRHIGCKTAKKRKQHNKLITKKRVNKAINIDLSNQDDEMDNTNNIGKSSKEAFNIMVSKQRLQPPTIGQTNVETKIKLMEQEIATYNKLILDLEEKEVIDDITSPYIESEFYKKKVVKIYKELCKLTNTESVKHHSVRLTVAPGHPEGPVKCLEQYINDNIDDNGNLIFPDIHDVIDCVRKANVMFKMGWSKGEIEKEARALFVHYGRTVQKRRQKREWRHLMLYVKHEAPDPADDDLALQARLQENARLAKTNEDELLNRYAQMENSYLIPEQDLRLSVDKYNESEQDSDYESASPIPKPNAFTSPETTDASGSKIARNILNSCNQGRDGNITDNIVLHNPWTVPVSLISHTESAKLRRNQNVESTNEAAKEQSASNVAESSRSNITDGNTSTDMTSNGNDRISVRENSEVSSSVTNINPNTETKSIDEVNVETCLNYTISYIEDETSNSEVFECVNNNNSEENTDTGTSQTDNSSALVKREPLDIPGMLEQLGNNYTATVIDIEDPFLVIEISDSSDDESGDDDL